VGYAVVVTATPEEPNALSARFCSVDVKTPVTDQAHGRERNQVASQHVQYTSYLKEDVVRRIMLIGIQGIIKLRRAIDKEEDILIGVRVSAMQ
jgi:hypothetical protein